MFRRSVSVSGAAFFLYSACIYFAPAQLSGQKIPTLELCNTGRTAKGSPPDACLSTTLVSPTNPVDGGPIVDGNWKLAYPYPSAPYTDNAPSPCRTDFLYPPAPVNQPDSAWYNPDDGKSQWLSPNGGGTTPAGWYIYATSYSVGAQYGSYSNYALHMSGRMLADDLVGYIYVSNDDGSQFKCGAIASFASNGYGSWTSFEGTALVLPDSAGYVYFIVYNDFFYNGDNENPTGLRVEFDSTYFTPY